MIRAVALALLLSISATRAANNITGPLGNAVPNGFGGVTGLITGTVAVVVPCTGQGQLDFNSNCTTVWVSH